MSNLSNAIPIFGGTMTGLLVLSGDPVTALGAVTKQYADAISAGLEFKNACVSASTTALTVTYNNGASGVGATLTNAGAMAAFSLDGTSPIVGQRVLIKNQASTLQNGIYTVTVVGSGAVNWVLTRSTDYDQPSKIHPGDLIPVENGTVNSNTLWLQTATVTAVGTDAITFSQFSSAPLTIPVSLANGGTNASLTASNGGLLYSTGSALAILNGTATANQIPLSGSNAAPSWSTATYPATTTINQILYSSAANTISGITTQNNGLLVTSNTGVPSILVGPGTTGNILQANTAAAPSWSTATYPSTISANAILYGSASNVVSGLTSVARSAFSTNSSSVPTWIALTDGQILVGSTAGSPAAASISSGSGISIVNSSNSITVSSTVPITTVVDQNSGSVSMVAGRKYVIDNGASLVTLTLPSTATIGDTFIVIGGSSGGWKVAQNASQQIHVGSSASTSGATGFIASSNQYDCVEITCITTNNGFACSGVQGNLTVN